MDSSYPQSCEEDATDRASDANVSCLDPLRHSESTVKSPPPAEAPSASKGFGLRKWRRRIRRRDVAKEATISSDCSKALKRDAPTSLGANRPKDSKFADNSEDSVGSVTMPIRPGAVPDALLTECAESRVFVAVGADSDDRSSRSSSSTAAASAPMSRYDLPTTTVVKEKNNKIKNTSAPLLRAPQGKGKSQGSKKARGERIKIETDNSHSSSSMESDSRSSNFVFMQGACSVTSNGKQGRVPMSCGGEENGDEARAEEEEFSEEVQTNYNQGTDGENEDYLRDNGGTGHPTADPDPLVESIRNLQSVHEVLENEVHRFGQLGRGNIGSRDINPEVDEPSSSRQLDSQINGQSTSVEPQVADLTEKVKVLEIRLKDANNKLTAKEAVINEATAGADRASKKEPLENEVEDLYKQKIEVEVEYLVLAKFVQKLKVAAAGDPIGLLNEQKALAGGEHVEVLDKLGKAEGRYYGDILRSEEVAKMERRRVCKVTSCFLMELILLVWVVWLLVMQLYPQSGIVVPT